MKTGMSFLFSYSIKMIVAIWFDFEGNFLKSTYRKVGLNGLLAGGICFWSISELLPILLVMKAHATNFGGEDRESEHHDDSKEVDQTIMESALGSQMFETSPKSNRASFNVSAMDRIS